MSYILTRGGVEHVFGAPFVPHIDEIAFALAHINRFTGHAGTYSVAEHCVRCALAAPEPLKLSALLHDAPEAWLGDVSAPLKKLIGPKYGELEGFYHGVVDQHFGVDTTSDDVKHLDMRMLATEFSNLITLGGRPDVVPACPFPSSNPAVQGLPGFGWHAGVARRKFIQYFDYLTTPGGRKFDF